MSKNYDQIATVDIDIATPIVDDTSFDNLLIMGPAPKGESQAPDVGVYSSIAEEEFDEDGNSIPGYTTSVPLAASLSASERASRRLTKCTFKARLAGAIHFAELSGSLTYEL